MQAGRSRSHQELPTPTRLLRGQMTPCHPLGTGMDSYVSVLAATDDTIYAGGASRSHQELPTPAGWLRGRDNTWHPLGTGMNSSVSVLVATDDTLYAGGDF